MMMDYGVDAHAIAMIKRFIHHTEEKRKEIRRLTPLDEAPVLRSVWDQSSQLPTGRTVQDLGVDVWTEADDLEFELGIEPRSSAEEKVEHRESNDQDTVLEEKNTHTIDDFLYGSRRSSSPRDTDGHDDESGDESGDEKGDVSVRTSARPPFASQRPYSIRSEDMFG